MSSLRIIVFALLTVAIAAAVGDAKAIPELEAVVASFDKFYTEDDYRLPQVGQATPEKRMLR